MKVVLTQANIVILASNHDPGIVSRDWLIQKEILTEASINHINTPGFSLVETANYLLQIDQQRLDIRLKGFNEHLLARLSIMAGKYIEVLPATRYSAVGLNSNWIAQLDHPNALKDIFAARRKQFDTTFHEGTYEVGGIVIYRYDPFRLQLTVTPQQSNNARLDFNYHSDISEVEVLGEAIGRLVEVTNHAHNIAVKLLGGEESVDI